MPDTKITKSAKQRDFHHQEMVFSPLLISLPSFSSCLVSAEHVNTPRVKFHTPATWECGSLQACSHVFPVPHSPKRPGEHEGERETHGLVHLKRQFFLLFSPVVVPYHRLCRSDCLVARNDHNSFNYPAWPSAAIQQGRAELYPACSEESLWKTLRGAISWMKEKNTTKHQIGGISLLI